MKSFIQKVLILVGLVSIIPFFSYAASVTCRADYPTDLVGEDVNISATVNGGNGTSYDFSWDGDDGLDATGESFSYQFTQEGSMTINVTASSTDSSDYLNGSCSVTLYKKENLPNYSASCLPSTDRAVIGQNITWYPTINGPLGPYTVTTWTGTDGLTGPDVAYSSSSDKFATMVSFESRYGSKTSDHNAKLSNIACSASLYVIPEEIHNPKELTVTGTCAAVESFVYSNDIVVWNSNLNISGGAAPYQVTWSDSLGSMGVGTSVSKSYSATGTVNAFLSVEDNAGQSTDIQCGGVTVRNRSTNGNNSSSSNNDEENATSTATTTTSTSTSTPSTATSTPGSNSTSTPEITGGEMGGDNTNGYEVTDDYSFTEDQNPGTYSEEIANLQKRLTEEGFYNGLVGGFFGPATEQALKDYQAAKGLTVTGILDQATRDSLNGVLKDISNEKDGSSLLAAAVGFAGENWPVALYALLIALAVGLISWLFFGIKKGDQNK